jgi:hypothetical protein
LLLCEQIFRIARGSLRSGGNTAKYEQIHLSSRLDAAGHRVAAAGSPTMGKGALVTYESGDFFRLLLQIRGSIFDNVLSKVRPGCPAAMPRRAREPDFFSREQKSAPPQSRPAPVLLSRADRVNVLTVTARLQLIIVSVLSIVAAILHAQGYLNNDNGTAINSIVRSPTASQRSNRPYRRG